MAHATKRKNICTAKVSDDFQGFFPLPPPLYPLPFATFRPSWFFGRIIKGHKVIAVSVNRDTRPRSTWLLCQKFLPGGCEGKGRAGWGGVAQCWRWHFGDKIPKLIVGLSTASQALKQKTGQQATAQHYTALHNTTQHYTARQGMALDSTQHWPTRWGINLKLRAAASMPHTHTIAHCFMLQQGKSEEETGRWRWREREREQVLKLCRQLVDEV